VRSEENLCEANSQIASIRHGGIEAGSFAQKRSVPRYLFAVRTVIIEPSTRAEQSTRASDISLNGCYLQSFDQFPPNTVIRVRIEQGEQIVEIWSCVPYVQEGLGTGIAFFEYPAEQRLTIQSWIANVIAFFDKSALADSEQQVERRRNKMQGTLVRFLKRLNDAIQKIFSFCYDIGDAFGKDLFPPEYISECGVQNHRHVWTDVLELAGRIDSVHARHGHVENDQVGPDSR
jgi:hypothetical protein